MGQCMEDTQSYAKLHPSLGRLDKGEKDGKPCFKLTLALSNEDQYIEWSKKINKLRYHCELKQFIYLPLREEFKQPRTSCQGSGFLQLLLQPYDFTLNQVICSGNEQKSFQTEHFLLRLLIMLVKFIKYNLQRCHKNFQLCFQNILLWNDGGMKIIPEEITSLPVLRPQYQLEIDSLFDINSASSIQQVERTDLVYQAGLICLCFVEKQSSDFYYCFNRREWKQLSEKSLAEKFKKIQGRFSDRVTETLKAMLLADPKNKITAETLTLRVQTLQAELMQKKQLQSALGMNLQMPNPMNGSNFYSKLNPSQSLLKISILKFDQTDRASTNMQLQYSKQVQSEEVESLEIL